MGEEFVPQDLHRIGHLQPEGWESIGPFFQLYLEKPFCFPVKIERQARIAAIGSAISNGATGWLAHVIVDPALRGRGLGRALTEQLMEKLKNLGCSIQLLIATASGEPVYRKLGFRVSCTYRFLKGGPIPGGDEAALGTISKGHETAILELDRRATGEDRRAMLLPFLSAAWVCPGKAGIRGFYLPTLAEGPIVASDQEAGLALLRRKHGHGRGRTVLPETNEAAVEYLEAHAFRLVGRAHRMVYGGDDPLDASLLYSRVGGHYG